MTLRALPSSLSPLAPAGVGPAVAPVAQAGPPAKLWEADRFERLAERLPAEGLALDEGTKKALDAKWAHAAKGVAPLGGVKDLAEALHEGQGLKASSEALKLTAETLAKGSELSGTLGAGGEALGAYVALKEGDPYEAAKSAASAVSKLSPALGNSTVGAVASAIVLTTGDDKLTDAAKQVGQAAQRLVDPVGSGAQRVEAAVTLTTQAQSLGQVGRAMGNAAVAVFQWGTTRLGRLSWGQGVAKELSATAKVAAASPVGQGLAKLNKALPWLNLAGVALAGKNLWDVHHEAGSSLRSKALGWSSLGLSGVAVWAGFALSGWAFVGVVAASMACDLALGFSRQADRKAAAPTAPTLARRRLA